MKKLILPFALLTFAISSYSQVKLFQGGDIALGSIDVPRRDIELRGNSVFTNNNNSIVSSALIRGNTAYSTASTPDFTFYNNDNSGIFHPAHNILGFSIDGVAVMKMKWEWNVGLSVNWHSTYHTGTFRIGRGDRVYDGAENQFLDVLFEPNFDAGIINSGTKSIYLYDVESEEYNDLYLNEVFQLSDRRVKKNIKNIDSTLGNKLYQLKAKEFQFTKGKTTNKMHLGFIAQDVELLYPDLVRTTPTGLKLVNYNGFIPLLLNQLQEQNKALEKQQKQITQLQMDILACCNASNSGKDLRTRNTTNQTDQNISEFKNTILRQNTPNPFSSQTEISWFIETDIQVNAKLYILDMNGTLLETHAINEKGNGNLVISGSNYKPGMYLYSLYINGQEIDTKKMILTH